MSQNNLQGESLSLLFPLLEAGGCTNTLSDQLPPHTEGGDAALHCTMSSESCVGFHVEKSMVFFVLKSLDTGESERE